MRIDQLISGLLCVGLVIWLLVAVGCTAPAPTPSEILVPTPTPSPSPPPTPTPSLTPPPVPTPEPNMPNQNQASENQESKVFSEEDSQKIAVDFLRSSPTFRFDGIENTLKLVSSEVEEKLYRWEFQYEFESRHAGYGDRTGLILAQVITNHKAKIVVEKGQVVHAVLDGKWDMLRQKAFKETENG